MASEKPVVDEYAEEWASWLSDDTKRMLYNDLFKEFEDDAVGCLESARHVQDVYDEFAQVVFWRVQHMLLNSIMDDEEIERRIYNND